MADLSFQPTTPAPEERNWAPILIATALVVAIIAAAFIFIRRDDSGAAAAVDPYAEKLAIANLKMSEAESFVGSKVFYLDGQVTNNGDRTVTGIQLIVNFRDSMDQVVLSEPSPMHLLHRRADAYDDIVELSSSPLQSGESKQFRLTFERIPPDWNGAYPEIKISKVTLK